MASSLKITIERFHNREIGEKDLIFVAQNAWNELVGNERTKALVDSKIREMRIATVAILGNIDFPEGDPIQRRVNPYKWLNKIPPEYANRESEYVLGRAEAFLNLLENLDPKNDNI